MNSERSFKAFEEAKRVLPGGVNSPVRSFRAVGGVPLFIDRGKGSRITDLDGQSYIDYCNSWGALLLGHAHPHVLAQIRKTIKKGTSFGAPTLQETALAQRMIRNVPSLEQIRLVSSGTEAVMSALRLARAYTGRSKIIKFDGGYHGHADSLLVSAGSGLATQNLSASAGVPADFTRHTLSVPFNQIEAIERVFSQYSEEIAGIIVEPIPANMGVVLPHDGFLEFLREITRKHNSLLIFDEVITGFRLARGGAQEWFKIEADLVCYGKIIGGGLPVGAYGGTRRIMEHLAPVGDTYQAGTLSGNPVAVSAGLAMFDIIEEPGFYEQLNRKAEVFIRSLRAELPSSAQLNAIGSMFTLFFTPTPVTDYTTAKTSDTAQYARFFHYLLDRGIYTAPAQFEANFISSVHMQTQLKALKKAMVLFN
ncbi:MAG: glutamate-1-semialdehyde 2,1-aminomutase [Candidatus Margulisiibacteriota bacterium]